MKYALHKTSYPKMGKTNWNFTFSRQKQNISSRQKSSSLQSRTPKRMLSAHLLLPLYLPLILLQGHTHLGFQKSVHRCVCIRVWSREGWETWAPTFSTSLCTSPGRLGTAGAPEPDVCFGARAVAVGRCRSLQRHARHVAAAGGAADLCPRRRVRKFSGPARWRPPRPASPVAWSPVPTPGTSWPGTGWCRTSSRNGSCGSRTWRKLASSSVSWAANCAPRSACHTQPGASWQWRGASRRSSTGPGRRWPSRRLHASFCGRSATLVSASSALPPMASSCRRPPAPWAPLCACI